MILKEAFQKFIDKRRREKEEFKAMEREERLKRRLEQKMKTPAQKEHEFYQREKQKEALNNILKRERKIREEKLKRLSNPYNKPNLFMERNDLLKSNGIRWIK